MLFPSDFIPSSSNNRNLFSKHGLVIGRCFGSKSVYRENHPNNMIVYNANVLTLDFGKLWYGDIDITLDKEKLKSIARELQQILYVLRETDARFGAEDKLTGEQIKTRAIWNTNLN